MTLGLFDPAFLGGLVAGGGGGGGYDADAQAYITAVEAADGQSLETGVRDAINAFVVGCKNDGIWSAIKASCILAGARTLAGALVPLVGTAPTNYNFVAGDYNRETGLAGDGSTKYLDTNRAGNADPQDSKHTAAFVSSVPTTSTRPIVGHNRFNTEAAGATLIYNTLTRLHDSASSSYTLNVGFVGLSRSTGASYIRRNNSSESNLTQASSVPISKNMIILGDSLQNAPLYANARLSFYSIGESLNLALLDARVSTLMSDLAAAIP